LDWLGAKVLVKQTVGVIQENDAANQAAEAYVAAIKESVQPRDAIEEMLVIQMAWTHARLAKLSMIAANNQPTDRALRVVHDAADRCANTFRRQMLALADYRRPARTEAFTVVKQLNAAQHQVVANGQDSNFRKPIVSNEQGSAPAALPAVADGLGLAAGVGTEKPALAVEQRPQNGGRQGSIQAERAEAR
jgi:hypothetical protein